MIGRKNKREPFAYYAFRDAFGNIPCPPPCLPKPQFCGPPSSSQSGRPGRPAPGTGGSVSRSHAPAPAWPKWCAETASFVVCFIGVRWIHHHQRPKRGSIWDEANGHPQIGGHAGHPESEGLGSSKHSAQDRRRIRRGAPKAAATRCALSRGPHFGDDLRSLGRYSLL